MWAFEMDQALSRGNNDIEMMSSCQQTQSESEYSGPIENSFTPLVSKTNIGSTQVLQVTQSYAGRDAPKAQSCGQGSDLHNTTRCPTT